MKIAIEESKPSAQGKHELEQQKQEPTPEICLWQELETKELENIAGGYPYLNWLRAIRYTLY